MLRGLGCELGRATHVTEDGGGDLVDLVAGGSAREGFGVDVGEVVDAIAVAVEALVDEDADLVGP